MVITGKDRGKTGTVSEAFPQKERVTVEGVNVQKKHVRSREKGKAGQVVDRTLSIHVSNVMIIDPKTNKPTRIGIERKDGKRVRIAKKSGQEL